MSNVRLKPLQSNIKKILKSKNQNNKLSILAVFILGFAAGFAAIDFQKTEWYKIDSNLLDVNLCFTPPSGCSELIAREITNAKESIYMHVFSFTSSKIADSLVQAHNKGVKIEILSDSSTLNERNAQADYLKQYGISIYKDKVAGLAHNKVIIIDKKQVITGSFNFTNAADKRNAENVILINDKKVAQSYLENWFKRKSKAIEYNF